MSSPKRRGPAPQDHRLFAPPTHDKLRTAVIDLSWLRTRGYAENSAVKLVGDRYQLTSRQRTAVGRCACSEPGRESRRARQIDPQDLRGRTLWIDGFNVLITLEAALAGALVLRGRDGCLRDLSSLHGSYRVLRDTETAVRLTCETLATLQPALVVWYLDKPVSNSGRLAALIREVAAAHGVPSTETRLVQDPDPILKRAGDRAIVATADSAILSAEVSWLNLASEVVSARLREPDILDLSRSR